MGGISAEPQGPALVMWWAVHLRSPRRLCRSLMSWRAEARVRRALRGGAGVSRRRSLRSSFCPVLAEPRQLPTWHFLEGPLSRLAGRQCPQSRCPPPSFPPSARGMWTSEEGAGGGQHQRRLGSPWSGDSSLFYHLPREAYFIDTKVSY